jgi:hypothetical protein
LGVSFAIHIPREAPAEAAKSDSIGALIAAGVQPHAQTVLDEIQKVRESMRIALGVDLLERAGRKNKR